MTTRKTSELTGIALDWAVAKSGGGGGGSIYMFMDGHALRGMFNYSTNWSEGGPIIEREGISITLSEENEDADCWQASDGLHAATGPTPLIAAMRCYVLSRVGDEVDVPEKLI